MSSSLDYYKNSFSSASSKKKKSTKKHKDKDKDKKSKKKEKSYLGKGLKIVDDQEQNYLFSCPDDLTTTKKFKATKFTDLPAPDSEDEADELPVIAAVIDERPFELQAKERFSGGKWRQLGLGNQAEELSSPPRHRDRRSPSNSPPRKSRRSPPQSPPRKTRRSPSNSPPRNRKRERRSGSNSPPRRGRRSPPYSPPRKSRRSPSNSPPRKSRRSPPRSPPRKTRRSPSNSPPRKSRRSPPRSPPRKTRRSPSNSPPRNLNRRHSPPRKIKREKQSPSPSPPRRVKEEVKPNIKLEQSTRRDHWDRDPPTDLNYDEGRNAQTIYRDRKTGKVRDFHAERIEKSIQQKTEDDKKEQYEKWGKGLKQVEAQKTRLEDALHEMSKPLARYKDDTDLDALLREQERDGDPMLKFLKQKKKPSASSGEPSKPRYSGPPTDPNRFGILPGHKWDGVDRSNGYEREWFSKINTKKASVEEAYKWSVEDM